MLLSDFLKNADDTDDGTVSSIRALADAAVEIADIIRRQGISLGAEIGADNSDGDAQKALDVRAEEIIIKNLRKSGASRLLSEEQEEPIDLNSKDAGKDGVIVAIDPLDGSSNISVNITTGTIFSILPEGNVMQAGKHQRAAGFFTYGAQTTLVLGLRQGGVRCFALNPQNNEFTAIGDDMVIPKTTNEFAINAAYSAHWHPPVRKWMDEVLEGDKGEYAKSYRMRWVGSLVADALRIFMRGGVFLYPADARKGMENGRLRLIYEANPIVFLAQRAGGMATDGKGDILEIEPQSLHQRTSLIFGATEEVSRLIKLHE